MGELLEFRRRTDQNLAEITDKLNGLTGCVGRMTPAPTPYSDFERSLRGAPRYNLVMIKATEKIWHNGRFIDWNDAKIHVLAHVTSYGSSVFEGVRCYATPAGPMIFRMRDHARRLHDSAKIYRMDIPHPIDELCSAMIELVRPVLATHCFECHGAGNLECHLGGVDIVVLPVDQSGLHIDNGVAAEHSIEHCFFDAFLDRRDVLARNNAADDLVFDDESFATLARPQLLLLDEHTASLDPRAAEQVMTLTERLVAEGGLTTLMVTHNMHQALRCGSRLVMLHAGRVILDVEGAAKRGLHVRDLVAKFYEASGTELAEDRLLLAP